MLRIKIHRPQIPQIPSNFHCSASRLGLQTKARPTLGMVMKRCGPCVKGFDSEEAVDGHGYTMTW
jgi:hypothetical protein